MQDERRIPMQNKRFRLYYFFACVGVLIASYYPLSMGVRVVADMLLSGTVLKENYPKYIIPYTPIAVAYRVAVRTGFSGRKLFLKV